MNIKSSGKMLGFSSGREVVMPYNIKKFIQIDDVASVLLSIPNGKIYNENIIFVSESHPERYWHVEAIYPDDVDAPFVEIEKDGLMLIAYTWAGERVSVDPASGRILSRRFTK